MFTRTSKYNEALDTISKLELQIKLLKIDLSNRIKKNNKDIEDYNRLASWITNRGGMSAIDSKLAIESRFNSDEINTLIRLCHPDKHNGSPSANRITTKLLGMRTK